MTMRRTVRLTSLACLAATVAACHGPLPGPLGGRSPTFDSPRGPQSEAATGAVQVTVRWPSRSALAIPAETEKIVVSVFKGASSNVIALATLQRTAGVLESTATLDSLPVGIVVISAVAQDATGKTVAAGSVSLTIEPNTLAQAALSLQSILKPIVTGLSPSNALPGTRIAILGSGFGSATDPVPAVAVGGVAVASTSTNVTRVNGGLLTFVVPDLATTSAVTVTFNGESGASATSFTTLRSVEMTPSSTSSFAPFGLVKFQLVAKDALGVAVASPNVPVAIVSRVCSTGACSGTDEIVGASMLAVGEEPGTIAIQAGAGSLTAAAIVTVHAFGRADLPADTTALGAVPAPADNATTQVRAALGKKLFQDKKLSGNQQMACASCHDPQKGWSDGETRSVAIDPTKRLPWNSLSLLDAAYQSKMFWNGRKTTLEEQAIAVLGIPLAMNASLSVISKYAAEAYADEFIAAYGATPSEDALLIAKALGAFERTLVTPPDTTSFDRWIKGDDTALSQAAKRGLAQFVGKSQCIVCHTGPLFTDGKFHNIAIPSVLAPPGAVAVNARSELINGRVVDWARYNITSNIADLGAIRTPTLRNVELSAPYTHNGSKATLEEVVKHYETFDRGFPNVDALMPFDQVGNNVSELIEFLKALTATPSVTLQ